MDFPLSLTLVLMMQEDAAARDGAAPSAPSVPGTLRAGSVRAPVVPPSSGVFSIGAPAVDASAGKKPRVA